MKKILLLNPPSPQLCVRDYYCTFSAKAAYCWPPQDLIALSGRLSGDFQVSYYDPHSHGDDRRRSLEYVLSGGFHAVIFTTGSLYLDEDISFVKAVKERLPGILIVASSAIFRSIGEEVMKKNPFIDGLLLDFTNDDALKFLRGDYGGISGMFFRDGGGALHLKDNAGTGRFSFPVPRHELFNGRQYRFPPGVFDKRGPFFTTVASAGCPFKCGFCTAASVPYSRRDTGNIMEEMDWIWRKTDVRNIFFADCSFTADPGAAVDLCGRLSALYGGSLCWICNSRAEPLLERETARMLRRAGCRMVMIGAESGDEQVLKRHNKRVSPMQVCEAVVNCRREGIRTLVYFILGLPGEDRASFAKTAAFIKGLRCDFISVSFAMPDFGTALRQEALARGLCEETPGGWDHSGRPFLSGEEEGQRLLAQRKSLYRRFYLRPGRLVPRLLGCAGQLKAEDFQEGVRILKSWL
jgi:hypothetical protein